VFIHSRQRGVAGQEQGQEAVCPVPLDLAAWAERTTLIGAENQVSATRITETAGTLAPLLRDGHR
jgi:hypothetical protein